MKKREEILLAVPDLRAWKDEEGWNIELCREERQVIQAESCYEELKKTTEDPLVKSYLKEKTERVRFLKTAVAKRRGDAGAGCKISSGEAGGMAGGGRGKKEL